MVSPIRHAPGERFRSAAPLLPMTRNGPTFAPVTLCELLGLALFAIAFASLVIGLMA